MKISVIGAGLIGMERINAIHNISLTNPNIKLLQVIDIDQSKLLGIKDKYSCEVSACISDICDGRSDWVFICTPHNLAPSIIRKCYENNLNIHIEKPLGRTLQECEDILLEKPKNIKFTIGFNYRFFKSVENAISDFKNNKFGKIVSINLVLGHGNSPGMEKSWKLDPIECGSGALLDPGIHLLDLVNSFSIGEINVVGGSRRNGFWNTGIDEEVHLILQDSVGTIFNIQTSLTRWRSKFRIEINGEEGYGVIDGRGKSYGPQSYKTGVRWGWQKGINQNETEVFSVKNDSVNDSFFKETQMVLGLSDISSKTGVKVCSDIEALEIMKLFHKCNNFLIKD